MSLRDALTVPSCEITDEAVYRDRRRLLQILAMTPMAGLVGCADAEPPAPPKTVVTPEQARSGFRTNEELTRYEDVTSYNNFYEFGTDKTDPSKAAKTLRTSPWSVKVSGECEKPGTLSLDDLLKGHTPEERIYRLRCVEGWSMVIPWLGVPLGDVLKRFAPTSKAKYVAFTTLADPQQMPGIRYSSIDWPYKEGLRIDEAMHPLTLLATGLYGKPLPQQNGAPLRLVVPWKYGFKSIKSIVEIRFVERMPETAWHELQPSEYGFFSNVNPAVDHPRWSQKTERRIAGKASKLFAERIPTRPFNGYADQVASLYAGMDLKKWY
ncbi:protein-methionine-sulfoxide reductase catalytic subunit MsrP [Xanthomonas rydalmerensis]|uniref:Protein-methionine-sulfoxide reductase catalytic subunit MsrP n=1 Tax=Xanthomonas rydalmerensis TaxID=3046274 RepID=A0ABZ0JS20_9XANT|nr:protein-methionine-sulfoxide reductase catalytic subunit MsrP [Xanthomonas sp. DM-2023]WOS42623.1 protein-methionine-sulfoxide reductase catalytic subunit MsrP [Xanthomonas sp. DM-2023]WOS46809.1 protein-methionine-sulfoxide reductase catalytic subunit MsrP [Xanthomonas sp. DM-2023]WOS50989.1 protein-methionine-sulfoxide reductase catalytic subunit MsrP [Xanthomonas sp. DM-2023]WOS55169.1 protein-methionine-sulfoxide reductase catalytic subunit MsrP [Xanthomonas sp. DM-2023]WOS59351.1 prote